MKKLRVIFSAVLVSLVGLMGLTTPAGAVLAEPTSVSLYDIQIFQDLLATDDFTAIVPYDIEFATNPDENVNLTFIFSILSPDKTTVLGSVLAYPRYNGGYGKGIVTFYIASGMTWEASYVFRVQENPAYYATPDIWDFTIGKPEYSQDTIQKDGFRAKILDSADELSTEWSVDLLTSADSGSTVFSTYGELYYINAVPGIQTMCPELFAVQIVTPSYTKRAWSYTLANSLRTKYAGTFIADFMQGYAGLFSMETNTAMDVTSIIVFVLIVMISVWKFKASILAAFTDGYAVLLLLMLNGFISMIIVGLIAFLSVMLGGIILFFNR